MKKHFMLSLNTDLVSDIDEEILKNQRENFKYNVPKTRSSFIEEAVIHYMIWNCGKGVLYKNRLKK